MDRSPHTGRCHAETLERYKHVGISWPGHWLSRRGDKREREMRWRRGERCFSIRVSPEREHEPICFYASRASSPSRSYPCPQAFCESIAGVPPGCGTETAESAQHTAGWTGLINVVGGGKRGGKGSEEGDGPRGSRQDSRSRPQATARV